jgi:hypothetical protein
LIKGNTAPELETDDTSKTAYRVGLLLPSVGLIIVIGIPGAWSVWFPCCYGAMVVGVIYTLLVIIIVNALLFKISPFIDKHMNLDEGGLAFMGFKRKRVAPQDSLEIDTEESQEDSMSQVALSQERD